MTAVRHPAREGKDKSQTNARAEFDGAKAVAVLAGERMGDLRQLNILEAAELLGGSTRLINGLTSVQTQGLVRLPTVSDYLRMGPAAEEMLLAIPNIGRTSVRELWTLLNRAVGSPPQAAPSANIAMDAERRAEESGHPIDASQAGPEEGALNASSLPDWMPASPEAALVQLRDNDREIVERRFGLAGRSEETLAEIGATQGVTRERIRQIEARAMRTLRTRFKATFERYLSERAVEIWNRLSADSGGVAAHLRRFDQRLLTPVENLAFAVLQMALPAIVAHVAREVENGWVRQDIADKSLALARQVLNDATLELPVCLDAIPCEDKDAMAAAVELAPHVVRVAGYLVRRQPTLRMRRTVRLHLLLRESGDRPLQLKPLHAAFRSRFVDDPCSTRDLLIVMNDSRHLFLNLYEDGWAAIGAPALPANTRSLDTAEVVVVDEDENERSPKDDSATTVAGVLRKILREEGPIGFDELREKFMLRTQGAYSRSSVGPILLMHADFVRFAPGIYGLEEQLKDSTCLSRGQSLLRDERQLALYCQARWAKEPSGLYPLWTPGMERVWAEWAFGNKLRDHLDSLLAVADIQAWPVSPAEQERWISRRDMGSGFHLLGRNPHSLLETVPTFVDIVRAAVAARAKGGLSWISANRVRGLRIDDRHAHSVLAVLSWLDILVPAVHWQEWHDLNGEKANVVDDLLRAYNATQGASWPKSVMERYATNRWAPLAGWLAEQDVRSLVEAVLQADGDALTTEAPPEEDLDSLMDRVAVARAIRNEGLA